ncbi:MAG: T9SS type A sorting domain-containing protein, partial [Salibacteraceae bacterium]
AVGSGDVLVPTCCNVISAGTIGNDQSNCGPLDPAPINSLSLPGGGLGAIEYVWLQSPVNVPNVVGNTNWTLIPGATGASYDPGMLSQTTYFIRCARRSGCSFFAGESNIVEVEVLPGLTATAYMGRPVTCNGGNNGSASVNATGGLVPYSYLWSNGATTFMLPSLTAGSYTVTVTDANGCTSASTATVIEPTSLSLSISGTDPTCARGIDGGASISVSGGTAPYQYAWSNGATSSSITGLGNGSYTVTITDAANCTATASVTIARPACCNITDGGQIGYSQGFCGGFDPAPLQNVVAPSGGIGTIEYVWLQSPVNVPNVIGNTNWTVVPGANGISYDPGFLTQTTYFIRCARRDGCSLYIGESNIVGIYVHEFPTLTFSGTDATCTGVTDGSLSVTPAGGIAPYTYNWSNGATTATANNLSAGTYTVTVTDIKGCTVSETLMVGQTSGLVVNTNGTDVSCNDGNLRICSVHKAQGGDHALTIPGLPGTDRDFIFGPNGGTFVQFQNGTARLYGEAINVDEPTKRFLVDLWYKDQMNWAQWSALGRNKKGNSQGQHVNWDFYVFDDTQSNILIGLGDLTGDTLYFTHRPSNYQYGLQVGQNANDKDQSFGMSSWFFYSGVVNGNAVNGVGDVNSTNDCSSSASDGGATATATGGAAPYTYTWSNGAVGASITGLTPGSYAVTVTDANGCTELGSVQVGTPQVLAVSASGVDANCGNNCDGFAGLQATGGTAPYAYEWSTGDTTDTATGLCAGSYDVTVTDANGCVAVATITLGGPRPIQLTTTVTPPSCSGAAFTASYVIERAAGDGHAVWLRNLPGGISTDFVFGPNGGNFIEYPDGTARISGMVSNTQDASRQWYVDLWLNQKRDWTQWSALGRGYKDERNFAGQNFTTWTYYELDHSRVNSLTGAGSLAGSYLTITHRPSNLNFGFQIGQAANSKNADFGMSGWFYYSGTVNGQTVNNLIGDVNFDISSITLGGCDGALVANATGGSGALSYAWSNGATGTSLSDLCAGTYTVTITDTNGCTYSDSVAVVNNNCLPFSKLENSSCDVTLNSFSQQLFAQLVPGASQYEFEVSHPATGFVTNYFRGPDRKLAFNWLQGTSYGMTYNVRVRAQVNGNWGEFGLICQVTTPAAPTTQLANSSCNTTVNTLNDWLYITSVPGATNYRYEVTGPNNFQQVYVRGYQWTNFRMAFVGGLQNNTTYNVRVAAMVGGQWLPYGPACTVTTPGSGAGGTTQLITNQCGITMSSMQTYLFYDPVPGANNYRYEVTAPGFSTVYVRGYQWTIFRFDWIPGVQPGVTYTVRIAARVGNTWGNYGSACTVTTPGSSARTRVDDLQPTVDGLEADEAMPQSLELLVYPNPNRGAFTLELVGSTTQQTRVELYNPTGQLILSDQPVAGEVYRREVSLEAGFAKGVYFIRLVNGEEIIHSKVIVQ